MEKLDECYAPNIENPHNYLLDTCVFDKKLSPSHEDVNLLLGASKRGYEFYVTELQSREIHGVPDRKGTYDTKWEQPENATIIEEIFELLDVKRVSCYGHIGYKWFVLLDGTYRLIEDENNDDERVKMFYDIFNHNNRHLRDAIIAEAAIYNHCTLVSVDNRLIKKVNSHFENRAISYDEFIKTL